MAGHFAQLNHTVLTASFNSYLNQKTKSGTAISMRISVYEVHDIRKSRQNAQDCLPCPHPAVRF